MGSGPRTHRPFPLSCNFFVLNHREVLNSSLGWGSQGVLNPVSERREWYLLRKPAPLLPWVLAPCDDPLQSTRGLASFFNGNKRLVNPRARLPWKLLAQRLPPGLPATGSVSHLPALSPRLHHALNSGSGRAVSTAWPRLGPALVTKGKHLWAEL